MRSNRTFEQTAAETGAQVFAAGARAADPVMHVKIAAVFVLALLTMIAAGVMTMHPSNASQADELNSVASQGLSATKGDRIATSTASEPCRNQAWGAWSEDCAAAISGASRVRNVAFVTIEKSTPTVNETILARYPKAN
ncbi:MAG: hypothetical protein Tsb0019_03520 [Roseibium sp.]